MIELRPNITEEGGYQTNATATSNTPAHAENPIEIMSRGIFILGQEFIRSSRSIAQS
jgi:hypothetical protein